MICFEDELMIIYDKSNDSNLLVGRKEKNGFDVLKEFKGEKADELYKFLTGNEVDHL